MELKLSHGNQNVQPEKECAGGEAWSDSCQEQMSGDDASFFCEVREVGKQVSAEYTRESRVLADEPPLVWLLGVVGR